MHLSPVDQAGGHPLGTSFAATAPEAAVTCSAPVAVKPPHRCVVPVKPPPRCVSGCGHRSDQALVSFSCRARVMAAVSGRARALPPGRLEEGGSGHELRGLSAAGHELLGFNTGRFASLLASLPGAVASALPRSLIATLAF